MSFEMGNDQPLAVNNFSGGITDNYIDCDLTKYKTLDNFTLEKHGKLAKPKQRPGSDIYDASNAQLPSGNARVGLLKWHEDILFARSGRNLYYNSAGAWNHLQGTTNPFAPSTITVANNVYADLWNRHLIMCSDAYTYPVKVYKDSAGVFKLRTAGLPKLPANPTFSAAGAVTHLYKFVYKYTYTVGDLTFIDRGTPRLVTDTTSVTPPNNTITFTAPNTLANTTETNWDTANIKIEVYRNIVGGTIFYYIGEVTNGTATYVDTTTDANAQLSTLLYTEDGSFDNDLPPLCTCLHVVDNVCLYGGIKDGSEISLSSLRQSKQGDIDSVPLDFEEILADKIIGISSYKSNPVVMCNRFTYRIEGLFDNFGRGGMTAVKIGDKAGCISTDSIVQTNHGVFWAGVDGFYYTNGYTIRNMTIEFGTRYAALISTAAQKRRIQGSYDSVNDRVFWTVQTSISGSADTDEVYVLDMVWSDPNQDQWCFYTWSGTSFSPSAITFLNGDLYRGHKNGYVLKHASTLTNDAKVDTAVAYASWNKEAIIYLYEGFSTSFGTQYSRKFTTRFVLTAKMPTNLSLSMESNSDDSRIVSIIKPLRSRGTMIWGDVDVYWGDSTYIWNKSGLIQIQRRYPANALRCMTKQMILTNAYVAIISSDVLGTVTVDNSANTVVLDDAAKTFPASCVDWYISFIDDLYVKEFLITTRTSATQLVVTDSGNLLVTGAGKAFQIRGIPKNEVFYMLEYAIDWMHQGRTQDIFAKAQTGDKATT